MADENFGIIVQIDPRQAVAAAGDVDRALTRNESSARDFEREAKAAMAEVAKSARELARAQEKAQRDAARATTQVARQAAKEQEETARALTIAAERRAKERAQVEIEAARKAAAAAKQAAEEREKVERFIAKRTADYSRQVAADQARANQALASAYRQVVGPAADYREKLNQIITLERQGAITAQQRAAAIKGMDREMRQFSAQQQGGVRGAISSVASSQLGAVAGPGAAVAVGVMAARKVVELGDEYTALTNKIRGATASEAEALEMRRKLFKSAADARVSVAALTDIYAQARIATKELGTSQGELLRVSELLAKATRGTNEMNRQAGLQQFGQALTKGKLQAEELMSIMENIPKVGVLLAQGMGMTVGELRKAAEAGKIGTQQMLDAIQRVGPEIEAQFGKSSGTTAESMQVLKDQVLQVVGGFAEQINLSKILGGLINELGSALRIVGSLVEMQMGFWHKINDWTGGIVGKIASQPGFFGQIEKLSSKIAGNYLFGADYLKQQTAEIERQTRAIQARQDASVAELDQLTRERFTVGITHSADGRATGYGITGNFIRDSYKAAADNKDRKDAAAADAFFGVKDTERAAAERARELERIAKGYQDLEGKLSSAFRATRELEAAESALSAAVREGFTTRERAGEIMAELTRRMRDQLDPYDAIMRRIADETEALKLDEGTRRRRAEALKIENDLRAQGVELSKVERAQLDIALIGQDLAAASARAKAAADEDAAAAAKKLQREMVGVSRTLTDQFNEEVARSAEDSRKSVEALGDALGNVGKGFLEAAMAGKASFEQLGLSVAKLLLQFAALQAAKSIFGAGSTEVSLLGSIFKAGNFAAGGSFTVPNGGGGTDSVPVAFRATPGERVVIMPPGSDRGTVRSDPTAAPQSVTIVNGLDPSTITAAMESPAGARVIGNMIERHIGQLAAMVRGSS